MVFNHVTVKKITIYPINSINFSVNETKSLEIGIKF
jgi:hypothetical protein